ncbi:tyrosine-type recombinase/integrase [Knoellia subterranea]|uniref:tyrosine-type recombinase/integrase n=1 Tax=Knoellia subterranea TaxID=184882 RepID=UPI00068AF92A|nr:tyrosine-type recombinase/integrase [Knoellia subterranea]
MDRQIQPAKAEDLVRGENLVEATGGITAVVTGPKHGSARTVYLPDALLTILAEHIAEHREASDPDRWLFADEQGRPWHHDAVEWRWRATRKDAGAPTIRLHHLRHFYASGLIASGCDVVAVSQALGHGSTTTTHSTYLHLWHTAEDRTRDAAAALAQQTLATVHEPCTEESIQA